MQNISQGGIFKNMSGFEISKENDCKILNFLDRSKKQRINIGNDNDFVYNVFVDKGINFDINVFVGNQNKGTINLLCLCNDFEIKGKINVNLIGNNNNIKLNIVGLVAQNGKLDCTGNFLVFAKTQDNVGDLMQENIFLGEKGKILVIPQLNIKSDQSQTSHGVKIQRLDKDKLFYIQSKGINLKDGQDLMIMSYFQSFFEGFSINEEQIQGYLNCLNQKCLI